MLSHCEFWIPRLLPPFSSLGFCKISLSLPAGYSWDCTWKYGLYLRPRGALAGSERSLQSHSEPEPPCPHQKKDGLE